MARREPWTASEGGVMMASWWREQRVNASAGPGGGPWWESCAGDVDWFGRSEHGLCADLEEVVQDRVTPSLSARQRSVICSLILGYCWHHLAGLPRPRGFRTPVRGITSGARPTERSRGGRSGKPAIPADGIETSRHSL